MKKLNQISLNSDGLVEQIRKQQELEKEISKISGVPAKYLGREIQQSVRISGGIEFMGKFMKNLPKYMKK